MKDSVNRVFLSGDKLSEREKQMRIWGVNEER